MTELRAQIVVPVHEADRPIRRAAESVLADGCSGVIVVAHNLDASVLNLPVDPRVSVVEYLGHPGKPGAAFDAGIAEATAPLVGIMGSDDWFEAGALEALQRRAESDNADAVIVPLAHQTSGARVSYGHNPRTLRRRHLQAARDRLFYRTAPLGLFRRDVLQDPRYRFGTEFAVGEDLQVSTRLWTSGLSVSHHGADPAYVVGRDARRRITLAPRPLAESGAAWLAIWDDPQVVALDAKTRLSLAVKTARVHLLGAVTARRHKDDWQPTDFSWLHGLAVRLGEESPGYRRPFRKASARTLDGVIKGDFERTLLSAEAEESALAWDKLMTTQARDVFAHDSSLSWLLMETAAKVTGGAR